MGYFPAKPHLVPEMFVLQSTILPGPQMKRLVSVKTAAAKTGGNNLAQAVRIYESVFRQRGTLSRGHDGWAGAGYHGNPLPPAHNPPALTNCSRLRDGESYDGAYPAITDSLANLLHACSRRYTITRAV